MLELVVGVIEREIVGTPTVRENGGHEDGGQCPPYLRVTQVSEPLALRA